MTITGQVRRWGVGALVMAMIVGLTGARALLDEEAAASPPAAPASDVQTKPGGVTLQAEEDVVGRLVLEARVNGVGPFRFIVDTGANRTAVSPALVERLDLATESQSVELNGVTGVDSTSQLARLSSVVSGRFARADVEAVVVQPRVLAGADGLIGADLLTDSRVTFDFVRRRVTIKPSRGRAVTGRPVVSQAQFAHGGLVAIKSWIGGVKTTAIIDTGAQNTFGNRALEARIPPDRWDRWLKAQVTVMGVTAHKASARAVVVPRFRVGRLVIRNAMVMFADLHVFDLWDLDDTPAMLLGMDVLGATRSLVIDYGREQVIMDPRPTATTVTVRHF